MIFLKSFFRKKNIKIYISIFSIVITFILISLFIKMEYEKLANQNYENSYLEFEYFPNRENEIKKLNNINEVCQGISLVQEDQTYYYFKNENLNLSDFEISIEKNLIGEHSIGDKITFQVKNINLDFIIKDTFENSSKYNVIYVNNKTYSYLEKVLLPQKVIYRVNLKNWNKDIETSEKIEHSLDVDNVHTFIDKKENINFEVIVYIFKFIILLFIIVFIIIFVITCIDMIKNEKKISFLYNCIGYTKMRRFYITFCKLFLLILISSVISIVLFYLFFVLYKFK